jgi:dihydroorotate dehydrogenase electron transfer subunit
MPVDVDATVLANRALSHDYNIVSLAAPSIARAAQPGQFVMVKLGDGCAPLLRRPFSVFEILRDARGEPLGISLLNKRVGVTTRLLAEVRADDHVACLGPLGRPFVGIDPPGEAWMVAGGVGVAPFVTLADDLVRRGTRSHLVYGARTAADLHGIELFEARGCTLHPATEDGSRGDTGLVTVPLERELRRRDGASPVLLYACGPTPMMRAVAMLAESFGWPSQVSLEPVMGCGLGGCYSCVVGIRDGRSSHHVRACLEGPVFDAATLDWDRLSGH